MLLLWQDCEWCVSKIHACECYISKLYHTSSIMNDRMLDDTVHELVCGCTWALVGVALFSVNIAPSTREPIGACSLPYSCPPIASSTAGWPGPPLTPGGRCTCVGAVWYQWELCSVSPFHNKELESRGQQLGQTQGTRKKRAGMQWSVLL